MSGSNKGCTENNGTQEEERTIGTRVRGGAGLDI